MCPLHSQRPENRRCAEFLEAHSRNTRRNLRRQRIAAVGIQVLRARSKIQFLPPRHHPRNPLLRDHVIHPPPCHRQRLPLIANAPCMLQQLPDRHLSPVIPQFRQILPDIVFQRQLLLLFQQYQGHRCELLRHRRHVKYSFRADGHIVLQMSTTVSFGEDRLSLLHHRNGRARFYPPPSILQESHRCAAPPPPRSTRRPPRAKGSASSGNSPP